MKFTSTLLAVSALVSVSIAAPANSKKYRLKTEVKPGQHGKERFNGQYVYSFHTGAGTGDACVGKTAPVGYLTHTNRTNEHGQKLYDQYFDLGTEYPWAMTNELGVKQYAAWQPVSIDLGAASDYSGYFIDKNGLNWNNAVTGKLPQQDEFAGWLVCDWWHGEPQLFYRIGYYTTPAPSSCAEVFLRPEYVK